MSNIVPAENVADLVDRGSPNMSDLRRRNHHREGKAKAARTPGGGMCGAGILSNMFSRSISSRVRAHVFEELRLARATHPCVAGDDQAQSDGSLTDSHRITTIRDASKRIRYDEPDRDLPLARDHRRWPQGHGAEVCRKRHQEKRGKDGWAGSGDIVVRGKRRCTHY